MIQQNKQQETNIKYFISQSRKKQKNQQHQFHQLDDDSSITDWPKFLLYSYIYVFQGIVNGLAATTPYLYPILPDYSTMAIFSANLLPFSFKFFIAPFLQKFTIISYGKRKTWMFASLVIGGLSIISIGFLPSQNHAVIVGILFIVCQFCMALLDISSHSVMIKQIKSKSQNSIIIGYGQSLGSLLGAFLVLKLTSQQFASSIGLSHPITNFTVFFVVTGMTALIPAFYIHFKYQETTLQSQKIVDRFSFWQIIKYYKYCLYPSSRYFRIAVFFLTMQQGLNFFLATYDYELVKAGFSRDTANTISNALVIPIIICTFLLPKWTNILGGKSNSLIFAFITTVIIDLYTTLVFPLNVWIIVFTSLITGVGDTWRFYTTAYMINDFPPHALTGMFITFLSSFSNFGKLTSIHTLIIGKIGWKISFLIGFGIQIIITILIPTMMQWIKKGDNQLPKQLELKQEQPADNSLGVEQPKS